MNVLTIKTSNLAYHKFAWLDLPSEEGLSQFRKIDAIMAPPGLQDVVYDRSKEI